MTDRLRVYISGPITQGDRNENFAQAAKLEKRLMLAGYAPLNPMRSMLMPHAWDTDLTHDLWLECDMPWVAVADVVYRLPGASVGADKECAYAERQGIAVVYSDEGLAAWPSAAMSSRAGLACFSPADILAFKPSLSEKKGDMSYTVKDSGVRQEFASGMVRDVETAKADYTTIFNGPMADRWAEHLTKGAAKYPNDATGRPNWMKAAGDAEYERFRRSAARHFRQWLRGDSDEDHAAAVMFNINGAEYVKNNSSLSHETTYAENGRFSP